MKSNLTTLANGEPRGVPSSIDSGNYRIHFDPDIPVGERVLFPVSDDEGNGMEDLRMVPFEDEGETINYCTYTAYDGRKIASKMFATRDFREFDVRQLRGAAVRGKGMVFFPRKINGRYAAMGRQDGVTLTMMYSDHIDHWETAQELLAPSYGFDLTQLGNCGPPVETSQGWLVLTHGVGPLRRYTLGLALLGLDDPSQVISYMPEPFMEPTDSEREGYVPNVLYTCGWMRAGDRMLIPYAMSDSKCGFATSSISDLLDMLKSS